MTYWNQVKTVTRWEFRRFYKPKNEAIGIAVMLFISVVFYSAGRYALSNSGEKQELTITESLDSRLTDRLAVDFQLKTIPEAETQGVPGKIAGEKRGILLVDDGTQFAIHAYKNTRALKNLRSSLEAFNREREMETLGINPADFDKILAPAPITESFVYAANTKSRMLLAFIFAGLMIMAVFLCFAYQFTAITGEKQLKITEQIVSAIQPQVWMDGKIFGITLTGVASMLSYSLLGFLGGVLYFQFTGTPVSTLLSFLYLPAIAWFLPFALTGILLWNAILAAIASAITDPNNSAKSSLMLLPVLFVVVSFLVPRDPDSALSIFLSWFPLTSASAMPMRWALTEVEIWQLAGSWIVLVLSFYLMRRLAARIFRVSILINGKEPTWGELFRQIRKSR